MRNGGRGVRIGGVGNGGREIDPETFGCAGAFDLALSDITLRNRQLFGWSGDRTSHWCLKVSRSTNDRATASLLKLDLYCLSKRLHISVYSASGIESLMYAFSRPSRVMMML